MPKPLQMLVAIALLITGWFAVLYAWITGGSQGISILIKLFSVVVLITGLGWILKILAKN